MSYNVWEEITCIFLKFNIATIGVWEWIINFVPHLNCYLITYTRSVKEVPGHQKPWYRSHYNDGIMGAMASQITSLTIVYSTVSGADQRKHQSTSLFQYFLWSNFLYDNVRVLDFSGSCGCIAHEKSLVSPKEVVYNFLFLSLGALFREWRQKWPREETFHEGWLTFDRFFVRTFAWKM